MRDETLNVKEGENTSQWWAIIHDIMQKKVAVFSLQFIVLSIFIAVLSPIIVTEYPSAIQYDPKIGGGANSSPNLRYPAGTDALGMDSFSRLLAGSETSLMVGFLSTLISVVIGVLVGLLAGYYQGWIEELAMRLTDFFLAVPFLILSLVMVQLLRNTEIPVLQDMSHSTIMIIVIGMFGWATLARVVITNTKQVKTMDYIDAAIVVGVRDRNIIFKHILPNILAPIVVMAALFVGSGILSEAALAFLGFADPYNTISWGISVDLGRDRMTDNPEQALVPGMAIFFLVLAINLLGDSLRDALDPRLRNQS